MDFAAPIESVIPSAHGAVLAVLARAGKPLTGRAIATLTAGKVGQSRTNQVLSQLADAGIVTKDVQSFGYLYRLNHEHVAAPAIMVLASMRETLMERMANAVTQWDIPAVAVWMFGSAARGEASSSSDIDMVVVRPEQIGADDPQWLDQIDDFTIHVSSWSGNEVNLLEFSLREIHEWTDRAEPLMDSLRAEALRVYGAGLDDLLDMEQVSV